MFSLSVDFTKRCTFKALQLNKTCFIDVEGKNEYFENDTVPGVVSLKQKNNSFCNRTEEEVVIYKCECRRVSLGNVSPSCQDALKLHAIN